MGIQIIQEHKPKSTKEMFGEAIGNVGQAAAEAIPEALRGKEVKRKEKDLKAKMKAFGADYESQDPMNPINKAIGTIYRSELPADQTSDLVKALIGVDPYKADQQTRLRLDSSLKYYGQRLKEMDNDIKYAKSYDRPELFIEKRKIQTERDQLVQQYLDQFPEIISRNSLEEEVIDDDGEEEEIEVVKESKELTFLDINIPNHKRIFDRAKKLYGNDKEKIDKHLKKMGYK